jgi:serine/threonine protein kinase
VSAQRSLINTGQSLESRDPCLQPLVSPSIQNQKERTRRSFIQTTLPVYLSIPVHTKKSDEKITAALLQLTTNDAIDSFDAKYRVQQGQIIAMGKNSVIKYCNTVSSNDCVVVKFYTYSDMNSDDRVLLQKNIEAISQLDHPNITKMLDFYSNENEGILVLENVSGGSLFDRICENDNYSEREAKDICSTILQAIKHLHDHDVVHRDLKPEHLHLTDDEEIKLTHFGLATKTATALVEQVSTLDNKAPEMLLNLPYGKAVDMWSFGILLFVLLGGYHPFDCNDHGFDLDEDYDFSLYKKILRTSTYRGQPRMDFPASSWASVSMEAKHLTSALLTAESTQRLTVEQALSHEWFSQKDDDSTRQLNSNRSSWRYSALLSHKVTSCSR